MVNIKIAEFLIRFISCMIAYFWVITIPNVVQAYAAQWAGDDTAARFGFTSLNPFNHVDPFGLIILIISCGFGSPLGWGRSVFIDPFNIRKKAKLIFVSFADVITHFVSALLLLIILEIIFGLNILFIFQYMILGRNVSHMILAQSFNGSSSLAISAGFIIFIAIYLHVLLGILYTILNSRDLYLALQSTDSMQYAMARIKPSNLFVPLILLFVFAEPLRIGLVACIAYAGLIIGTLLGIH
jgi:hypothetical protein